MYFNRIIDDFVDFNCYNYVIIDLHTKMCFDEKNNDCMELK